MSFLNKNLSCPRQVHLYTAYSGHILYFVPFLGICQGALHCPLKASRQSLIKREELAISSSFLACSCLEGGLLRPAGNIVLSET